MKVIGCPVCGDVVALTQWKKSCKCGKVYGKYLPDRLHAKVSPGAILQAYDTSKITYVKAKGILRVRAKVTFEIETTSHDGTDIEIGDFEE